MKNRKNNERENNEKLKKKFDEMIRIFSFRQSMINEKRIRQCAKNFKRIFEST